MDPVRNHGHQKQYMITKSNLYKKFNNGIRPASIRVLSRTINPQLDLSTGQVLIMKNIITKFSSRDIPVLGMLSGFRTGWIF